MGTVEILGDVTDIRVPCIIIPDAQIHNYRLINSVLQKSLEPTRLEEFFTP